MMERLEKAVAEGRARLEAPDPFAEAGVDRAEFQAWLAAQPQEVRDEVEREIAAFKDKLESDFPKRTATRTVRTRPSRQMV
jgi:hypothetical protein